MRRRYKKSTTTIPKPKTNVVKVAPGLRKISPEELMQDGTLLCSFTIESNPATKKNHQTIIYVKGYPKVIPSKQYTTYEKLCEKICKEVWIDQGKQPINYGVSIEIKIFLKTWCVGDHVGYLQALGDIFEKWGIVSNDKWIAWAGNDKDHWLGGKDPINPRVEVKIFRFRHPYENFRKEQEDKLSKKINDNILK